MITRKMLFGEGNFSGVGNEHFFFFFFFFLWTGFLPHPQGLLKKVWGKGQGSPYMVGSKSKMKGGETFLARWGIQGV